MKYRNLSIACTLIACCFGLAACGGGESPESAGGTVPPTPAEATAAPDTGSPLSSEPGLQQAVGVKGAPNMRELGGYRAEDGRVVRSGLLLRGGELSGLSEEDIRILAETYSLGQIIDLRQPDEIAEKPDPDLPGVNYINLSLVPPPEDGAQAEADAEAVKPPSEDASAQAYQNPYINLVLSMGDVREGLKSVYTNLVTVDHSVEELRELFDLLLDHEDGGVLFHCTSGKDRTGVTAALVLSALGVDRQTVIDDFMLTNVYLSEKIEAALASAKEETDDPDILEGVRILNGVDQSYIEAMFETVDQEYGSMDAFLETQLGLTEDKISLLREKYLM